MPNSSSFLKGYKLFFWKIIILILCFFIAFPCQVIAAPYGGQVISGSAAIAQSGTVTNINQSTNKAIINWQGFSIASNETVNFNQPSVYSMTLNRVIGNEKSIISGALNATGKVYLINANGILFTQGASVNTAGLIASTLNITNEDFLNGNYVFQGNGQSGSVINMGVIKATGDGTGGGYVALLGDQVKNEGIIIAERGTVSLNGAQKVTLNFNGDSLANVTLDEGSLNALVENKKAIIADGGKVILTAKAANDLVSSQVNVDGIVQAQTLADLTGGSIEVNAYGGTTTVSGTLDASAPNGGNGGTIETSGTTVKVADTATITTAAAKGTTGTWTIDPDGFTIAAYGGDMTGATLGRQLASNNVTIFSTQGSGTDGDINVNDTVTWAAATLLTLNATNAITVNGSLAPTGTGGGVALLAGTNITLNTPLSLGANSFAATAGGTITLAAPLSWTGNQTVALTAAEDLKLYSTITGEGGTLNLTATSGSVDLDGATSLGATTVNVAAGTDVNLNAAFTWTGDTTATLAAGNNININAPLTATGTNAGLVMNYGNDYTIWTQASYSGAVLNEDGIAVAQTAPEDAVYGSITLSGANASLSINGQKYTLIHSMSDLDALNDYKLSGTCESGSGTCYWNPTTQSYDIVQTKSATGTCSGGSGTCWWNPTTQAYDLADQNGSKYYNISTGEYTSSYSSLAWGMYYNYYYNLSSGTYATRSAYTGTGYYYNAATGLYDAKNVYYALATNIDSSTSYSSLALQDADGKYYYTASPVSNFSGILAGLGNTISNLTINSTSGNNVALVGIAGSGTTIRDIGMTDVAISATGNYVAALVGTSNDGTTISNAYSTGAVAGSRLVGGLVGYLSGSSSSPATIKDSFSTASVSGISSGGLLGYASYATISSSHASGNVTSTTGNVGGLIGSVANTSVFNSYATGNVDGGSTTSSSNVGGLIGYANLNGDAEEFVQNSFATGNVSGYQYVGGLIGYLANSAGTASYILKNSYAFGGDVTGYQYVGGLVGRINGNESYPISVNDCFAQNTVTSTLTGSNSSYAGGLIGRAVATNISGSYAITTVNAQAWNIGGLVGYLDSGSIDTSYVMGSVNGSSSSIQVGGLVGNTGLNSYAVTISNSYSTASVSGGMSVGGLVGGANAATSISNSYATGDGTSVLVGSSNGGEVTNSSYHAETQTLPTSEQPSSVTGTSPGQEAATTAADATSAAATSASSVISNIQSQAASAAYVARQEAISQVVEVADGQQLSVSQSAPTTKEVVTPNTTKEISLAEAIRNFAEDGGSADNAGVSGASYSAGIKTVTADGVTYIVDESNQTSDDNKDKKNAKKSE